MKNPRGNRPRAQLRFRSLLGLGLCMLGTFAVGLVLGLNNPTTRVVAAPQPATPAQVPPPAPPPPSGDYSQRVVAYIYGTTAITREELGEYLIARYGADKLDLLVNKRIIEKVCREKGIEVTNAEINATLENDCAKIGVSRDIFLQKILKERKVSLYEWKEDVLKPQLLLTKLCRDRVHPGEDELRQCFESCYGEKVEVRIILYPKNPQQERIMAQIYEKVRSSEEEFIKAAREQPDSNLAMSAGIIKPISHYGGTETQAVEKAAFRLQPGDVSEVVETAGGLLIMKCIRRIPPDRTKFFDAERDALTKMVVERDLQREIPKVFKEIHDKAEPKLFIKRSETEAEMMKEVKKEIESDSSPSVRATVAPRPPANVPGPAQSKSGN